MIYFLAFVVVVCVVVFWGTAIVGLLSALVLGFGAPFAFGAPWFWLLILAESGLLFWALDNEDDDDWGGTTSTMSILIVLTLLQFLSDIKPFTYVWQHPWWSGAWFAAYMVVGAGWSVGKWWFAEKRRYRRTKETFLKFHSVKGTAVPEELQEKWAASVIKDKTDPTTHKARFLSWIAFWPWSMVWTLLNDPFKRLVRRIYYELQGVYQRITDSVWKP